MKSLFHNSLHHLLLGAGLVLAGCTATSADVEAQAEPQLASQEESLAACGPELEETVEHACYHGDNGPFININAGALGSPTLPNVNLPHTAYQVSLPAAQGSTYAGAVTYRPIESGEYAFLLGRKRGLRIFDGSVEVSRECTTLIDETACGSLRRAVVADLEAGKVYRLEFRAVLERNASFLLVVEEAGHHEEEPLP